jgi:hypothetical protein
MTYAEALDFIERTRRQLDHANGQTRYEEIAAMRCQLDEIEATLRKNLGMA